MLVEGGGERRIEIKSAFGYSLEKFWRVEEVRAAF